MKRMAIPFLALFIMCALISCTSSDRVTNSQADLLQESRTMSQPEHINNSSYNASEYIENDNYDVSLIETYEYNCNPYYLLPEKDPFIIAMKDNPIDKYSDEIMADAETTKDMMNGLYWILQEWKTEMRATELQLLESISDETLKENMLKSQKEWEEYVNVCLSCDRDIITENSWSTDIPLMFLSKRIELFRERTIHLKYLMYLHNIDLNNEAVEKALSFSTIEE